MNEGGIKNYNWQIFFKSQLLKRKSDDSEDQIWKNEQSPDDCNAQQNDGPGPLVVSTKQCFNLEDKKFINYNEYSYQLQKILSQT